MTEEQPIGVLESDPDLFNILNNAIGTMHYHRLMSALHRNDYTIVKRLGETDRAERLADNLESWVQNDPEYRGYSLADMFRNEEISLCISALRTHALAKGK